jgi:hypothetical protein
MPCCYRFQLLCLQTLRKYAISSNSSLYIRNIIREVRISSKSARIILSFLLMSHMYYWIWCPIQFSTLFLKWTYSQSHFLFFEEQNKDHICRHTLKGGVHLVTFPGYQFLKADIPFCRRTGRRTNDNGLFISSRINTS